MPIKKRHSTISLGTVSGDSPEIDASSFDYAIVYIKNDSGSSCTVTPYAAPQDFGTAGVWYKFGDNFPVDDGELVARPCPSHRYSEFGVARRIKINTSESVSAWVELVREIG